VLLVIGIISESQLLAFTGCGNNPASQQVDATRRWFGRPSTMLLLTREDGKQSAASLIEALTVQLTLAGVLSQLLAVPFLCGVLPKNIP